MEEKDTKIEYANVIKKGERREETTLIERKGSLRCVRVEI